MLYRQFGKTGWSVSAIGMGTWNIGNQWGELDDVTVWATIRSAFENGINLLDTAESYGIPNGLSEEQYTKYRDLSESCLSLPDPSSVHSKSQMTQKLLRGQNSCSGKVYLPHWQAQILNYYNRLICLFREVRRRRAFEALLSRLLSTWRNSYVKDPTHDGDHPADSDGRL